MNNVLHALFVAWQDPVTRRFYPVGRLAQIDGAGCEDGFEFVYIHAALEAEIAGFQPFLSFPDRHQVYRGKELFPMFDNRLVSQKRADFPDYINQLGLLPANATPISILSRSSGRRATDTLELFSLPEFESEYGYRTWFWIDGLRHFPDSSVKRVTALELNERLFPLWDIQNRAVPNAIPLRTADMHILGYMPSYLLDDAHTLTQTCNFCEIYVDRVNPPPAPVQQRLLCRLEACWPDGFAPYSSARYQPLSEDAATVQTPAFNSID